MCGGLCTCAACVCYCASLQLLASSNFFFFFKLLLLFRSHLLLFPSNKTRAAVELFARLSSRSSYLREFESHWLTVPVCLFVCFARVLLPIRLLLLMMHPTQLNSTRLNFCQLARQLEKCWLAGGQSCFRWRWKTVRERISHDKRGKGHHQE